MLDGIVNAASGLLLVALGAYVALLRPRRRSNVAFAVFAAAFGLAWVPENLLAPGDALYEPGFFLYTACLVVAAAALPLVGLWFPRPVARARRGTLALAGGLAVALGAAGLGALAAFGPGLHADEGLPPGIAELNQAAFNALMVGLVFLSVLLPLRHAALPRGADREARQLALLAVAFALYPAVVVPFDLLHGSPALLVEGAAILGGMMVAGALWLRNAARARSPASALARDVALLVVGASCAGAAAYSLLGPDGPQYGLARVAGVALLGYAIVRHQLLGIDVRVRWTIQQSTLAAAFVGVFFVVSESASQFFADADGGLGLGPYLGIAAAGLLLFALAPLQRAAEKVARAAMPGAMAPSELGAGERRRLYLDQARAAWADGAITRDERALLDRLRDGLGLTRDEASRLESEAAAPPSEA